MFAARTSFWFSDLPSDRVPLQGRIGLKRMSSMTERDRIARPNPESATSRSLAVIDREIPEPRLFQGHAWELARRLIHTTGDVSLAADLVLPEAAVEKGIRALKMGAPVLADARMTRAGISSRLLKRLGSSLECLLDQPHVMGTAIRARVTRSRAAMLLAEPKFPGAIMAVGKAPASLSTLLDIMDDMFSLTCRPTLIIGMPAGFADAAEAKDLLEQSPWTMLTVRGTKGGPALAAATVNALAEIAWQEKAAEELTERVFKKTDS